MTDSLATQPMSGWRPSKAWARYRGLSRNYWIFFVAALLYESGIGLYFFLFNLFLLDLGFDKAAIGLINGAFSLGVLTATLPVGMLSRKLGNHSLLLFCFAAAPSLGALRALWMWEPAQIGLAFTAGLVMSIWTVCFLPVSSSLTSESNRASAIALILSVGIAATALGSAGSGYLSHWIGIIRPKFGAADVKRVALVISCAVAALGSLPLLRLPKPDVLLRAETAARAWDVHLLRNPFLRRFLPCMALWTSLLAAFTPFAGIYFVLERHLVFGRIGLVFSASQLAPLAVALLIPMMVNRWGMLQSILITQLATALLLIAMVVSGGPGWSAAAFVVYSATQWMSSTASYTLLMNAMPDVDRSPATAMTMFSNSLGSVCAVSAAGMLLDRFHFAPALLAIAILEAATAILFQLLLRDRRGPRSRPALCAETAMD